MKKNNPKRTKKSSQKAKKTQVKQKTIKPDLLQRIDAFLARQGKVLFWVFFGISVLFSLLLFDMRISVGGDDAAYIKRAYDFAHSFRFPTFQGPLYPMLLSIIIAVFGINLVALKTLSLVFIIAFIFFFYKAFHKHFPPTAFFASFFILCINAYVLYYGGQTYNEALFMFLEALFFFVFFRYFIETEMVAPNIKVDYKRFLWLGFVIFLMSITKNAGIGALIVVIIYFIIQKNWKSLTFSIGGFLVFLIPFQLLKRLIWGTKGLQFESQASTLLQKHPYDPSKGQEDFMGFIQRFIDNSHIYLSKHLYEFFGLRPEITHIQTGITIFTYLLFFVALVWAFRKNKYLLFTGIYVAVFCGITFLILQKMWDSARLIVAFFPFILIFLLSGLYYMFRAMSKKTLEQLLNSAMVFVIILATVFVFYTYREEMIENFASLKFMQLSLIFVIVAALLLIWLAVASLKDKRRATALKPRRNYMIATQIWLLMLFATLFLSTTDVSIKKIKKQQKIISHNLKGDMLYGYSPDWVNYIKMCQWASENTSDTVSIACRKPSIAFIYGERPFYGIYKLPVINADTMLVDLEKNNTAYFVMKMKQWSNENIPPMLRATCMMQNIGFINGGSEHFYGIYQLPDEKPDSLLAELQKHNIKYRFDGKKILEELKNENIAYFGQDADYLLNRLIENNVRYIIMANLRKYESRKTKHTINTIRRYLYYIQLKYPHRLKQIHRIGQDEEAYLFELLY